MKTNRIFFLRGLALLLLLAAIPALGSTQQFFNGTVKYTIAYTGKAANDYLVNKPPTSMDMHIRDDNFIIQTHNSRIPRTYLYIGDSNHTYIVEAGTATYYLRTYFNDTSEVVPVAEKVRENENVKGIMCDVYKVKKPDAIIYYYVSNQYKIDLTQFAGQDNAKADFLVDGLDGRIPLKKVSQYKDITVTSEITGTPVQKLHDLSNFRIPSSFKRKIRDPRK